MKMGKAITAVWEKVASSWRHLSAFEAQIDAMVVADNLFNQAMSKCDEPKKVAEYLINFMKQTAELCSCVSATSKNTQDILRLYINEVFKGEAAPQTIEEFQNLILLSINMAELELGEGHLELNTIIERSKNLGQIKDAIGKLTPQDALRLDSILYCVGWIENIVEQLTRTTSDHKPENSPSPAESGMTWQP